MPETDETFNSATACKAFGFNAATLRGWLNHPLNPLRVDAGDRPGWRRFTYADAVRLKMLSHLVNQLYVEPTWAIYALNSAFDVIGDTAREFHANWKADGHAYRKQSRFLMFMRTHDLPANLRVFDTLSELVRYGENRAISGSIIFELSKETLTAINAVTRAAADQDEGSTDD